MRKYKIFFVIGFVFCLILSCNLKSDSKTESLDPIMDTTSNSFFNPLCDSLYLEKIHDFNDTIICGIKYVYGVVLSDKYILAFREFSDEWKMSTKMEILVNGICSTSYDEETVYYEFIIPSPSNKYVLLHQYYTTLSISNLISGEEDKEILRFASGGILDIEKEELVRSVFSSDINGNWNYCDQWIVDGKVVFDPEWLNEDEE